MSDIEYTLSSDQIPIIKSWQSLNSRRTSPASSRDEQKRESTLSLDEMLLREHALRLEAIKAENRQRLEWAHIEHIHRMNGIEEEQRERSAAFRLEHERRMEL